MKKYILLFAAVVVGCAFIVGNDNAVSYNIDTESTIKTDGKLKR